MGYTSNSVKSLFLFSLFLLASTFAHAKSAYLDSLQQQLSIYKKDDTSRVLILGSLADYYAFIQFDSCFYYATKTLELSKKLNYPYGMFLGYLSTFHGLNCQGNYPMALEASLNIEKAAEQLKGNMLWVKGWSYYFRGVLNREMADYPDAIAQLQQSISLQKGNGEFMADVGPSFSQIALIYGTLNKLDSALWYAKKGYALSSQSKKGEQYFPLAIGIMGSIHLELHNYDSAKWYFHYAIKQSDLYNNLYFQARIYNNLASLFDITNFKDSCIYYAGISLEICQLHNFAEYTFDASKILTKVYESEGKSDSILKYMRIMLVAKDSVFSQSKGQQFQKYAFNEIKRLQDISIAKERYQNQVRIYVLLVALFVFLLLGFILYRNSREKQKAKIKIEKAYEELKSTQAQLIQSEKMASLGELTAGIAHEIQNPLNFVNNFSEVNKELIGELKLEIGKGNLEGIQSIAGDIEDNEEKINHHGKRADSIVKAMLQHSRTSVRQKELTDVNSLVDEFLKLSYQSLRATDQSFNALLKTELDGRISKINIIPQDIGRVLLNLYNNAFYTLIEKKIQQGKGFEPVIFVVTKKGNGKVEIRVRDNGNGIPQNVKDKIFQPFFTTKPAGQGTGLGLSLSYDIIKAHGGEIIVNSKEKEYCEFVVTIPG